MSGEVLKFPAALVLGVLVVGACGKSVDDGISKPKEIDCRQFETCKAAVVDLSVAQSEMQSELEKSITRLRTCKPENSTRCFNMPRAIQLIETEQKAWLSWRDAKCDVFTFSMEDTSAEGELRAVCRAKETRERTTELKKIGTE
ncbi:MAG: lysozyme inhibitor LprI family protein [Novosphingobium sp.]